MRTYKTRAVARFAKHERIADTALIEAIDRAGRGLIDADLGGGLIKMRVPRQGAGRRGGYRMLVGFRAGERAIFIFGFAKSDLDNISHDQLAIVRQLGQEFMQADETDVRRYVSDGRLLEVKCDEQEARRIHRP